MKGSSRRFIEEDHEDGIGGIGPVVADVDMDTNYLDDEDHNAQNHCEK